MLTEGEFIAALRSVGERKYHDKHPFNTRMNNGDLSRTEMQTWIANRFYYQKNIPIKDALILAKLPGVAQRREWLQRIIDHDGRQGDEGGIEGWYRLGEAAGISRNNLSEDAQVIAGVRYAVDAYVNYCRLQPWFLAVAASLTELFAPDAIQTRLIAIRQHYRWIEPSGLAYFENRLTQAPRDVSSALDMVISAASSSELQHSVIEALEFKCDVLWSMLDAIELHCRRFELTKAHLPAECAR